MRARTWLTSALAWVVLPAATQPPFSRNTCCPATHTGFGLVMVQRRDLAQATTLGDQIKRKAGDVLQLDHIKFAIVDADHTRYKWAGTTPQGLSVYPWRFVHGTNFVAVTPPPGILPHEVAHDVLKRYLIHNTQTGQYGTDAPDWLDESVAVAFELPEDQAQRRCEARSLLQAGKLISLKTFLSMKHPDLASIESGSPAQAFVFRSTTAADTPAFYAMSMAFPEYLAERTGSPAILREAVDAFNSGADLPKWVGVRLGLSDGDDQLRQLDHGFSAWLAGARAYRCGR